MRANSAHCELLKRIEKYTLEFHPLGDLSIGVNKEKFNPMSIKNQIPAIFSMFWGAYKILQPFLFASSFIFFYYEYARKICVACMLIFGASLYHDNQFRLSNLKMYGSVQPGVYYRPTKNNVEFSKKVEVFETPHYIGTPWAFNGDIQTLLPFACFSHEKISYYRRWVRTNVAFGPTNRRRPEPTSASSSSTGNATTTSSNEAVALDIAFPPGGYDESKAVYFILHGLNGGSSEEYLLDFVLKAKQLGHTIVVMIARGLMLTPTASDSIFNGARLDDVHASALVMRQIFGENAKIGGIGYSMGAVILANYTISYGKECALDNAVCVSGSLDVIRNMNNYESKVYWQKMLTLGLKETVVAPSFHRFEEKGFTREIIENQVKTVEDIDEVLVAPYFGYKNLLEYYQDMSPAWNGKLERLTTPLFFMHAINDPIISHETFAPYVSNVDNMNEHLFVLMTDGGGHVGWPTGSIDFISRKWQWMTDTILDFSLNMFEHKDGITKNKKNQLK